jgi:hypothetical protein
MSTDQQWTGLAYCNGSSDQWQLCDESSTDSSTVLSPGDAAPCWCPSSIAERYVAFSAPISLAPQALLPTYSGGSISYYDGFGPTGSLTSPFTTSSTLFSSGSSAPLTSTSNTSMLGSGSTASSPMSATPTSLSTTAPGSTSSSLSTGAKAGIGVGAATGALTGLALLWLLATCIRRRKKENRMSSGSQIRPRSQAFVTGKDPSDEVDPRSPTWSGHKSELPAEERASVVSPVSSQQAWTRPTSSEVEGTLPTYQSMGSLRSEAMGDGGPVYKPYRKEEVPPVGMQVVPETSGLDSAAYMPGRKTGSSVYEMPAQVPGSTLPQ